MSISRRVVLTLLCALAPLEQARAGLLSGRVALGIEGASLEGAGPMVVYLEGIDVPLVSSTRERVLEIHQKNASVLGIV